jgi:hypothetical protein
VLIEKTSMTMGIGETDAPKVMVKPDDLHPVLLWESSDENIASVVDGVVTGQKAGKARIKVSVKDQVDMYAECEYTIMDNDVNMETLDILEEPVILRPGGHQQLTVNFTPANQNEMILWSSTNESVANVSKSGKVEAIRIGTAFIIARSERTGVSDTAFVSVEGAGTTIHSSVPTNKPQTVKVVSKPKPSNKKTGSIAHISAKPTPHKIAQTSGSKNLGYAVYKGRWPNDVKGRMEFKTSHIIDSKDPKGRVAQAGDYVVGEWCDGHLVQGVWYDVNNRVKGSILIGR